MTDRLSTIRSIYDARAPTYDTEAGFHPRQAADYVGWMALNPGFNVLDLACGTGAITIPSSRAAGTSGKVIGVDISPESLKIARAKSETEGLNVKFLEHDISNLEGLEKEGIVEGTFDVISCASAFVLLEDPHAAVNGWAKLLKRGGKLIFDVPTNDSMVQGVVLEKSARQLNIGGVSDLYGRTRLDSEEKVRKLLTDAGLDDSECFTTEDYEGPHTYHVDKAGEMFDKMIAEGKWSFLWFKDLAAPQVRSAARDSFCKEFAKLADEDGEVKSHLRLHMAIGRQP